MTVSPARLSRRASLAYLAWALIALAYLAFFALDLGLDYTQLLVPCAGDGCNFLALSSDEMAILDERGWSSRVYAAGMTGAALLTVSASCLLAVLILWRQGRTLIGWSVSLALIVIPISMISDPENAASQYPALFAPAVFLAGLGMLIMLLFLYLFPNGRLYPRWSWVLILLTYATFTTFNLDFMRVLTLPDWAHRLSVVSIFALFTLAAGFQVARYRRQSTPVERQQTRWIILGIFIFVLTFPIWMYTFGGVADIAPGMPRLLASVGGWLGSMVGLSALPVTIAIAILRYRLWDIDLVIRRTLQYTLLTGLLALAYFGSIVLLQNLFFASQTSEIAIVLSTLAIAALFTPLRRRIQDFIDRRFYRKKYNAERALAQFAATARDEVDMDKLAAALIGVVQETMQPEKVSLWLISDRFTRDRVIGKPINQSPVTTSP